MLAGIVTFKMVRCLCDVWTSPISSLEHSRTSISILTCWHPTLFCDYSCLHQNFESTYLRWYLRMHVHMHVCACVYTRVCVCTCMCVHACVCMHVHMCACVCTYAHMCTCAYTCMCVHICTRVCTCVGMYMHVYACVGAQTYFSLSYRLFWVLLLGSDNFPFPQSENR